MRANWVGRRQAERKTCSIKAQARFYDGSPPLDCIVTDFSVIGARIEFPADFEPPPSFDLFVPSRGDTRHALLRWETPDAIGVEFTTAKATSEDLRISEVLVRISRLEDELRALRAEALLRDANAGGDAAPRPIPPTPDDRREDRRDDLEAMMRRVPDSEATHEEHAAMARRVAALEVRNDDVLQALKKTLLLLAELRGPLALPRAG